MEAGVGAYVVDGLRKERVKAILDMAVSRFNAFNQLRDELERARQAAGGAQADRARQGHPDERARAHRGGRLRACCARRR